MADARLGRSVEDSRSASSLRSIRKVTGQHPETSPGRGRDRGGAVQQTSLHLRWSGRRVSPTGWPVLPFAGTGHGSGQGAHRRADQLRDRVRLRDHNRMRGVDLDGRGPHALGVEALLVRMDGLIGGGDGVPRGQGLPGRRPEGVARAAPTNGRCVAASTRVVSSGRSAAKAARYCAGSMMKSASASLAATEAGRKASRIRVLG